MDLSKKDKKAAREIIEKGLQKELAKGLYDFDTILHDWKGGKTDNRSAYHTLYKAVKDFDKHIAKRYDAIGGSHYFFVIAGQLLDGTINESDLQNLSEEVRQKLLGYLQMAKE